MDTLTFGVDLAVSAIISLVHICLNALSLPLYISCLISLVLFLSDLVDLAASRSSFQPRASHSPSPLLGAQQTTPLCYTAQHNRASTLRTIATLPHKAESCQVSRKSSTRCETRESPSPTTPKADFFDQTYIEIQQAISSNTAPICYRILSWSPVWQKTRADSGRISWSSSRESSYAEADIRSIEIVLRGTIWSPARTPLCKLDKRIPAWVCMVTALRISDLASCRPTQPRSIFHDRSCFVINNQALW